jgi:trypsin
MDTNAHVKLGMHRINLTLDGVGPEEFDNIETIPIAGYVIHPDYDDETLENDFALIQLQSASILYADNVVELDSPIDDLELLSGDELVVFGLGVTSSVSNTMPNVVQEVTMDYISNEECESVFELAFNITVDIPSSMLCAERNGVGSCFVRITITASHSPF